MPDQFIQELYKRCTATTQSSEGKKQDILIQTGVNQVCPLSRITFNLTMEPLKLDAECPGGFSFWDEHPGPH